MFIALEGLSGTGKTTIARSLAEVLRAVQVPTVPDEYKILRNYFEAPEQLDARFLFFLSAICEAGLEVRRHALSGRHVVVESYLARTIAFHRGMGSAVTVELPGLLRPDVTFHLICTGIERQRRRSRRGGDRHLWDQLARARAASIAREYRRFPMHLVETTELSPTGVVHAILRHPLNGGCDCENGQHVAGHPNLLSAVPRRTRQTKGAYGGGRGRLRW
jgi:thymidylate kinase